MVFIPTVIAYTFHRVGCNPPTYWTRNADPYFGLAAKSTDRSDRRTFDTRASVVSHVALTYKGFNRAQHGYPDLVTPFRWPQALLRGAFLVTISVRHLDSSHVEFWTPVFQSLCQVLTRRLVQPVRRGSQAGDGESLFY